MKTYPFLDLGLVNKPIEDELKKAACRVIDSGRYLHSEETHLLEQEVAAKCEAKYCVAVSNGLDALKLIFRAYKEMGLIHEGDKVIVPANTFIASVLAVSDNGLVPVTRQSCPRSRPQSAHPRQQCPTGGCCHPRCGC